MSGEETDEIEIVDSSDSEEEEEEEISSGSLEVKGCSNNYVCVHVTCTFVCV